MLMGHRIHPTYLDREARQDTGAPEAGLGLGLLGDLAVSKLTLGL